MARARLRAATEAPLPQGAVAGRRAPLTQAATHLAQLLRARSFAVEGEAPAVQRLRANVLAGPGELLSDAAVWIGTGAPPSDRLAVSLGEYAGTLGPNSFGFLNNLAGIAPLAAPMAERPRRGSVALVVPRRDALPEVVPLLCSHDLGVSWLISVGDADPAEVVRFLAIDPATTGVLLALGRGARSVVALPQRPGVVFAGREDATLIKGEAGRYELRSDHRLRLLAPEASVQAEDGFQRGLAVPMKVAGQGRAVVRVAEELCRILRRRIERAHELTLCRKRAKERLELRHALCEPGDAQLGRRILRVPGHDRLLQLCLRRLGPDCGFFIALGDVCEVAADLSRQLQRFGGSERLGVGDRSRHRVEVARTGLREHPEHAAHRLRHRQVHPLHHLPQHRAAVLAERSGPGFWPSTKSGRGRPAGGGRETRPPGPPRPDGSLRPSCTPYGLRPHGLQPSARPRQCLGLVAPHPRGPTPASIARPSGLGR